MEKIVNFPIGLEKRRRIDERKGRISCEISERWIQLPEYADQVFGSEYIVINVMTLSSSEKERKLCELILDRKQLLKMLNELPVSISHIP